MAGRPKIGLLGIMQALYDEMLPGITERQAGYAKEVAIHLKEPALLPRRLWFLAWNAAWRLRCSLKRLPWEGDDPTAAIRHSPLF